MLLGYNKAYRICLRLHKATSRLDPASARCEGLLWMIGSILIKELADRSWEGKSPLLQLLHTACHVCCVGYEPLGCSCWSCHLCAQSVCRFENHRNDSTGSANCSKYQVCWLRCPSQSLVPQALYILRLQLYLFQYRWPLRQRLAYIVRLFRRGLQVYIYIYIDR